MQATADRLEFAPPEAAGKLRALALAIAAHLVLLAALTWGVNWSSRTTDTVAEAELWSAVPQEAAPRLIEPPRPEPTIPKPVVKAATMPAPEVQKPPVPDPNIALEQEKQRKLKEQQDAKDRLEKEKLLKEKQQKEKLAQEKLQKEKQAQEKLALQKREQEKKDKQAVIDKKQAALKAQEEAIRLEAQRQANIQRATGLANATGGATATGTATQSSGPSASYGGKIQSRVRPNIVFTEEIATNPAAEVEVRTSPDGTIIARTLRKSSGVKAWDEAVLRAIDKTEKLPADTDGRVPPVVLIAFRPKA